MSQAFTFELTFCVGFFFFSLKFCFSSLLVVILETKKSSFCLSILDTFWLTFVPLCDSILSGFDI